MKDVRAGGRARTARHPADASAPCPCITKPSVRATPLKTTFVVVR